MLSAVPPFLIFLAVMFSCLLNQPTVRKENNCHLPELEIREMHLYLALNISAHLKVTTHIWKCDITSLR